MYEEIERHMDPCEIECYSECIEDLLLSMSKDAMDELRRLLEKNPREAVDSLKAVCDAGDEAHEVCLEYCWGW